MDVEQILDELKYIGDTFPEEAVRQAVAQREAITPALLDALREPEHVLELILDNPDYGLPFFAMYLLAQFREERAYPLIVDLYSLPGEDVSEMSGDIVTEDLPRILASVSGGDTRLIKRLAEDTKVNEWVRGAALNALVAMVIVGQISREEAGDYFASLFRGKLPRKKKDVVVWGDLVYGSFTLRLEELLDNIRQAYRDGLVDPMLIELEDIEDEIGQDPEDALNEYRSRVHYQLVDDAVKAMSWWAAFSESKEQEPTTAIMPDDLAGLSLPDSRVLERSLARLTRVLSEQDFQSAKEMDEFLANMLESGEPMSFEPSTPLEKAQDLMYDAWEESSSARRIKLAREALAISGDCADAYVLLAEESASSLKKALDLYQQGVEAGERALGPEVFEEDAGDFWGILETRPYMRARAGLASCLWMADRHEEAITHYQEMLRLNPDDNQGLRYELANILLEVGDDKALYKLLERYKNDGTATWLYSRALYLYRQTGDSRRATKQLRKAIDYNPHVPTYLLGERAIPREMPEFFRLGDENEAVDYALGAAAAWRRAVGALDWLRGAVGKEQPRSSRTLGRNDPCWCGSGKKYKNCHWRSDQSRP
jgi:tetratricopeptide (TPR) repeat protein